MGIKILHIQEVYDTLSLSEAMRETDFDSFLMLCSGLRSCLENGGCSVGRSDKKTLYHYTDFQAVDGILRCAQLRVNNVLRMNDSAEMRHFMNRLCSAIAERLESRGDRECSERVKVLFREEMKKE